MRYPNKYPGTCYRCGKPVAAAAGVFQFENHPGLRWKQGKFQRNWTLIEHHECHEKFAGTNVHYLWSPADESS